MAAILKRPALASPAGRWISLSRSRRLLTDLLHFAGHVPGEGVIGNWNIGSLAKLRIDAAPRIGWAALFMKAYGLVSAENPLLRAILYEVACFHTSISIHEPWARMTVARKHEGEDWVFLRESLARKRTHLSSCSRRSMVSRTLL